ncbi:basic proline-rich protein-like [Corvus kubaryi]|uniref:basic proline-rich protein-like n=1 Tax=Corvus kubaryi TaxID=68294 RepID=UPI001C040C1E|nr:basic proline-rich protein-like [Corvus kubaryi]
MAEGVKEAAYREHRGKGERSSGCRCPQAPDPGERAPRGGPVPPRPRRSISLPLAGAVLPYPCLAHARALSSSSAPGPRPVPSGQAAGAARGGEPGQQCRHYRNFCRIRLGWCRLPSAVGAPSPSGSRRGGGRQGHGRARTARTSRPGAGTERRSSPASPAPSLRNKARPCSPPLNAPTPPPPGTLASPAPSRSTHPLPRPHCADPAPPVPPTPPAASPGRPAPVPPLARSPGKDGRGQRCAWCRWPGLREAAGCRESRARWQRGSGRKPLSPRRVPPPPPPHPTPRRL